MNYPKKLFHKEHEDYIVDYKPGKIRMKNSEMVFLGKMFHYTNVKEKEEEGEEEEYLFLLTKNNLYYLKDKVTMNSGEIFFSYIAKVHIAWLKMSYLFDRKKESGKYYMALSNSKKKVIYRVESEKELKCWKNLISPFVLQNNFLKKYNILKPLACGSTCCAYIVEDKKTKKIFACKRFKKEGICNEVYAKLVKEITMLRQFRDHPNVCKIHSVYESENSIYLVSEYCEGGKLFNLEEPVSLDKICFLINSFLKILRFFRDKKIIHGNLFFEKILLKYKDVPLTQNTITLINFKRARGEKDADPVAFNYQRDIQKIGEILFMAVTGKSRVYIETKILENNQINKNRKTMFLESLKDLPLERKLNSS